MPTSEGKAGTCANPRILLIGDLMTDVIVRPEGPMAKGSDRRATIAVRAGRLGGQSGGVARVLRRRGRFRRPRRLRRCRGRGGAASQAGVTAHLIGDPERPTGRLVALIDPSGERSFFTDRGANEALCAADIPDALIAGAAHIHLSGYSFFAPSSREAVLDVMRRAGATPVSVDPASAEFLREVGPQEFLEWTKGAAILFPNEEEAAVLTGSDDPETQCARLAALYPLVVVKRGAAAAKRRQARQRWRIAAPKIEAVDTTGAGDAFVAAFLAARLKGAEVEAALKRAVAAGAKAGPASGEGPKCKGADFPRSPGNPMLGPWPTTRSPAFRSLPVFARA